MNPGTVVSMAEAVAGGFRKSFTLDKIAVPHPKGNQTMLHLLLKWILGALALLAVTYLVPGFRVVSLPSALVAVLVIGFLNMTLGLLLKVITFPFAILTLGLLFLVINAFM